MSSSPGSDDESDDNPQSLPADASSNTTRPVDPRYGVLFGTTTTNPPPDVPKPSPPFSPDFGWRPSSSGNPVVFSHGSRPATSLQHFRGTPEERRYGPNIDSSVLRSGSRDGGGEHITPPGGSTERSSSTPLNFSTHSSFNPNDPSPYRITLCVGRYPLTTNLNAFEGTLRWSAQEVAERLTKARKSKRTHHIDRIATSKSWRDRSRRNKEEDIITATRDLGYRKWLGLDVGGDEGCSDSDRSSSMGSVEETGLRWENVEPGEEFAGDQEEQDSDSSNNHKAGGHGEAEIGGSQPGYEAEGRASNASQSGWNGIARESTAMPKSDEEEERQRSFRSTARATSHADSVDSAGGPSERPDSTKGRGSKDGEPRPARRGRPIVHSSGSEEEQGIEPGIRSAASKQRRGHVAPMDSHDEVAEVPPTHGAPVKDLKVSNLEEKLSSSVMPIGSTSSGTIGQDDNRAVPKSAPPVNSAPPTSSDSSAPTRDSNTTIADSEGDDDEEDVESAPPVISAPPISSVSSAPTRDADITIADSEDDEDEEYVESAPPVISAPPISSVSSAPTRDRDTTIADSEDDEDNEVWHNEVPFVRTPAMPARSDTTKEAPHIDNSAQRLAHLGNGTSSTIGDSSGEAATSSTTTDLSTRPAKKTARGKGKTDQSEKKEEEDAGTSDKSVIERMKTLDRAINELRSMILAIHKSKERGAGQKPTRLRVGKLEGGIRKKSDKPSRQDEFAKLLSEYTGHVDVLRGGGAGEEWRGTGAGLRFDHRVKALTRLATQLRVRLRELEDDEESEDDNSENGGDGDDEVNGGDGDHADDEAEE